jgi:hypothetical protein
MVNKKTWLGILVMVLVFGMTVIGCDIPEDTKDGTFEFKIRNGQTYMVITKVEFFNGQLSSSPLLQTYDVNLQYGETSEILKVSGFNNENALGETYICVKLYFTSTSIPSRSGYTSRKKGGNPKIQVEWTSYTTVNFSEGKW